MNLEHTKPQKSTAGKHLAAPTYRTRISHTTGSLAAKSKESSMASSAGTNHLQVEIIMKQTGRHRKQQQATLQDQDQRHTRLGRRPSQPESPRYTCTVRMEEARPTRRNAKTSTGTAAWQRKKHHVGQSTQTLQSTLRYEAKQACSSLNRCRATKSTRIF